MGGIRVCLAKPNCTPRFISAGLNLLGRITDKSLGVLRAKETVVKEPKLSSKEEKKKKEKMKTELDGEEKPPENK